LICWLGNTFNKWPIPQLVINANKDVKLDQNPGVVRIILFK